MIRNSLIYVFINDFQEISISNLYKLLSIKDNLSNIQVLSYRYWQYRCVAVNYSIFIVLPPHYMN